MKKKKNYYKGEYIMKKKKALIMVMIVSIVVLSFSGIALGEKLRVACSSSPWLPVFQQMLDIYTEKTGQEFELLVYPHLTLGEKMHTAGAEKIDAYDILTITPIWMSKFMSEGWIVPLKEADPNFQLPSDVINYDNLNRWDEDLNYPGPDGELYGVPIYGNICMYFYREDLFKKAGLKQPETWDDVLNAAKELHNPPQIYGFAQTGTGLSPAAFFWSPIMWAFGGDITKNYPDDWTVTIDEQPVIKALEYAKEMVKYCPPGVASTPQADILSYLANGKVAQALNVTAAYPYFDDPEFSMLPGKISMAPPPHSGNPNTPRSSIGVWFGAIPPTSPRKEEALEFLKWYVSEEAQVKFGDLKGIPVNSKVINDLADRPEKEWRFFDAYLETFPVVKARPQIPELLELANIIGAYFQEVISNKMEPTEAAKEMKVEIEKILKNGGYLD